MQMNCYTFYDNNLKHSTLVENTQSDRFIFYGWLLIFLDAFKERSPWWALSSLFFFIMETKLEFIYVFKSLTVLKHLTPYAKQFMFLFLVKLHEIFAIGLSVNNKSKYLKFFPDQSSFTPSPRPTFGLNFCWKFFHYTLIRIFVKTR